MKVFIYSGTSRRENSTLLYTLEQLKQNLTNQFGNKTEIVHYPKLETKMEYCTGCSICFYEGYCPLKDDMDEIQKELLDSDIFVLASPVYFHGVSGSVKTFIDRITYWNHVFKLSGKIGMTVTVNNSNGELEVKKYLEKVMQTFGISLCNQLCVKTSKMDVKAIDSLVRGEVKKLSYILDSRNFPIDSYQEDIFKNYRNIHQKNMGIPFEKNIWESTGMTQYESYREYFYSRLSI